MIDLSLIEMNSAEEESFSASPRSFGAFGFMTSASLYSYKNEVLDVTKEIVKGKYDLKNKFTIIFLYDFLNDDVSREFIATYGGKLHNYSSASINILTYFSSDMVKRWSNVQNRECIAYDDDHNGSKVLELINNLQKAYKVNHLPSIVVIKKEKEKEESFVLDLSIYNKKKEDLYKIFKDVMEKTNDYCEDDFSILARNVVGDSYVEKGNTMSYFNTSNYIADLVKEENKKSKYNLYDLALDLGISERGLRDKRAKDTFTRDECFYIAIKFSIDIEDLNELLRVNNQREIALAGRDGIIRKCLYENKDIYESDNELRRNGYKGLIKNH